MLLVYIHASIVNMNFPFFLFVNAGMNLNQLIYNDDLYK